VILRWLPTTAFLLVQAVNAWTADEFQRTQPETVTFHLYVGLLLGALAWGVVRGLLWTWDR